MSLLLGSENVWRCSVGRSPDNIAVSMKVEI